MNFQGVVMNVADLDRSLDFYRDVLGFTLLSREEELASARAPGNDGAQILVLRALGSSPLGELATSACEPSSWRSSRPISWSGSPAFWRIGDSSSAGVTTASGPQWWVATRTGWPSS